MLTASGQGMSIYKLHSLLPFEGDARVRPVCVATPNSIDGPKQPLGYYYPVCRSLDLQTSMLLD